jgi:uncharacterized protein (TIGR02996 family)
VAKKRTKYAIVDADTKRYTLVDVQKPADNPRLLAAILADPWDDGAREAFADWCRETGQVRRATFIAGQLRMDRANTGDTINGVEDRGRVDDLADFAIWEVVTQNRVTVPRCYKLSNTGRSSVYFTRGFPSRLQTTTHAFLRAAPLVFARHPVVAVNLVDLDPSPTPAGTWALRNYTAASLVDAALGTKLVSAAFKSGLEARDALNDALVGWARQAAGLGPLPATPPEPPRVYTLQPVRPPVRIPPRFVEPPVSPIQETE